MFKFFAASDLRMGSRDEAMRLDGKTIHVTRLQVYSLDPEPTVWEVVHTAVVEDSPGQQVVTGYLSTLWTDLEEAHEEFKRVHLDPPVDVPEGVNFEK